MTDSRKTFLYSFDFTKDLSLYIHVPFCFSRCGYCAFYSEAGCPSDLIDAFTDKLIEEINIVNEFMGHQSYKTAFIGGGNPGCLGASRLERIAKAVCVNGRPSEFSTEMNPESLDCSFFPLFRKYFTRLSMGVQSLNQKALAFLGRNAASDSVRCALELSQRIHEETGCTLSYDLITCLGSWHDDLADVKALVKDYPSEHLSVYALTLEEGTALFRKNPTLPDSDAQYDILKHIWYYLSSEGYEHYEVSNFAKEGYRCVHNCRYWAYRQYLGLGPGAASTAFSADGKVSRFNFMKNVRSYAETPFFSGYETERLSDFEAFEEMALMGLRYAGGLDLKRAGKFIGRGIDLKKMTGIRGFHAEGENLVPDEEGLMTADAVARELIGQLSMNAHV